MARSRSATCTRSKLLGFLTIAALLLLQGAAIAEDAPEPKTRSTVSDLIIGEAAATQAVEFSQYACGTNGGPPSVALAGFADYAKCPVEAETGLHEVDFQYDDEIEYWALANNLQIVADRYHGTTMGGYEVIASALIDDAGVLRGIRVLTDDRTSLRSRFTAYQMSEYVVQQYSPEPWSCIDLPVIEGETPVAKRLIKQNCKGTIAAGQTLVVETRLLRRVGQKMVDPFTGEVRGDRFVASSRFEVLDASVPVPENLGADR